LTPKMASQELAKVAAALKSNAHTVATVDLSSKEPFSMSHVGGRQSIREILTTDDMHRGGQDVASDHVAPR